MCYDILKLRWDVKNIVLKFPSDHSIRLRIINDKLVYGACEIYIVGYLR